MTLPTCPREGCTATGDHYHGTTLTKRAYAPRTPQPKPAAVVLPTVEEVRQTMDDAYIWHDAAQDVLDLIAARITPWKPIEPGTVIKAGTVTRIEWGDRDAREAVTRADYTPCQTDPARYYLDPRTVPEREDPAVAAVVEWLTICGPIAKYTVPLSTSAYAYITVEADSPEDAIDAAMVGETPYICAQCSGWGAGYTLELGEEWQEPSVDDVYEADR